MSRILKADTASIQKAARVLKSGGLVAFPTETVYGLGADALNARAVCRIFEVKRRPSFDPLIVHVENPEQAFSLWKSVPPLARELARRFWPGPLTLVLEKIERVPDVVTAGLPTVAVRMPANAVALGLIRALGRPIAAPSANRFGRTSPTTARAVAEELRSGAGLILDGGPCRVGVESTVLKIARGRCTLLRPGGVPVESIEKLTRLARPVKSPPRPESPGQTESHYAPGTPFFLLDGPADRFLRATKMRHARIGVLAFRKKTRGASRCEVLSPRGDLAEAASNLFQMMRKLDKMRLDILVAERVPEKGLGLAVMDRLKKASSGKTI